MHTQSINFAPPQRNRYAPIWNETTGAAEVIDTTTGTAVIPDCYSIEHSWEEADELNDQVMAALNEDGDV